MIENENNKETKSQMKIVIEIKEREQKLKELNSSTDAFEDLRMDYWLSRRPKDNAMFIIVCRHSDMDDSSINQLRICLKKLHIDYDAYLEQHIDNVELRKSILNSLSNNRGKDLMDILAKEFPESSKSTSSSSKGSKSSRSSSSSSKSSRFTSSSSSKSSSPLPGQQLGPYTGPKSLTSDSNLDIFNIFHDPIPWTYIFIGMTIMSISVLLLLKYIYREKKKILRIEGRESKLKNS
jgi:hypothetical protein